MQTSADRDELDRLHAGFRVARLTGLWRSPYPQSQWSDLLGLMVREALAADPGLRIECRASVRPSVHGVGSALPAPCVVWSR